MAQHLTALTKDEITAPHVNLVPLEFPGDLYLYVGTHVWSFIEDQLSYYTSEMLKECDWYIDELTSLKNQIHNAEVGSEFRKQLTDRIVVFRKSHEGLSTLSAPVFWSRIKDNKQKRKVCKRGVMTIPYGGTGYGLGQQVIDDSRKHGIEQLMTMEHRWGSYIGRVIYDDCKVSMKKPTQLLSVFEAAGRRAEEQGKFLSWNIPLTNFPVVQHYVEGTVKKLYIQYGPPKGGRNSSGYYENTLQLAVCFLEDTQPSARKQSQGASPNAIHSLDAAHLMLTVHRCNFPVTTIHDSFGCLLGDMPELFITIRETFVELYQADPLASLMKDIDGDLSSVEIGTLDINLVIESEYAFC